MKLVIGSDHRGFNLKHRLTEWFKEVGYEFEDVGAIFYDQNDDYPIFATRVAEKVASDNQSFGIVICGSGVGVCVAANKVSGIRCGQAISVDQVKAARSDENLQLLSLAADYLSYEMAKQLIEAFVNTEFVPAERHNRRLEQIKALERK